MAIARVRSTPLGSTSKFLFFSNSSPFTSSNSISRLLASRQGELNARFSTYRTRSPAPYSFLKPSKWASNHATLQYRTVLTESSSRQDREKRYQRDDDEDREDRREGRERTKTDSNDEPKMSLGARLKVMMKQYGYAALAVYLGLSALDFPLCFLAVRTLGTERISQWEQVAIDSVKKAVGLVVPGIGQQKKNAPGNPADMSAAVEDLVDGRTPIEDAIVPIVEHQLEAAVTGDQAQVLRDISTNDRHGSTGLWTQLVLAYVVHKSLIFIRVPLTAAILPKFVRSLRKRGWKIGGK